MKIKSIDNNQGKITYTAGCLMPSLLFVITLILKLCGVDFPWIYVVLAPVFVYFIEITIFISLSLIIFMVIQKIYKINEYENLQKKEHSD